MCKSEIFRLFLSSFFALLRSLGLSAASFGCDVSTTAARGIAARIVVETATAPLAPRTTITTATSGASPTRTVIGIPPKTAGTTTLNGYFFGSDLVGVRGESSLVGGYIRKLDICGTLRCVPWISLEPLNMYI